ATTSQGCSLPARRRARSGPMPAGSPGVSARRVLFTAELIPRQANVDIGVGAQFVQPAPPLFLRLLLAEHLAGTVPDGFARLVLRAPVGDFDDEIRVA